MPGSLERQKLRKKFVQMLEKIIHANASNEIVGHYLCAFEDNHSVFFFKKCKTQLKVVLVGDSKEIVHGV